MGLWEIAALREREQQAGFQKAFDLKEGGLPGWHSRLLRRGIDTFTDRASMEHTRCQPHSRSFNHVTCGGGGGRCGKVTPLAPFASGSPTPWPC